MINYLQGNLLTDNAEALVNTVNEVGVMGKGIALMFREKFPDNARVYEEACRSGLVRVGTVLLTPASELFGPSWIIHFPTKKHWRHPSKFQWIKDGLVDLARVIREKNIRSIALPPLGCGNGGLDWNPVREEIESTFADLTEVDVRVYAPTNIYQNSMKREGVRKLTVARALIVDLVRRYSVLGIDFSNLEVHKLAWFLHRAIRQRELRDPLKLKFTADRYGPYADNLRHLLNGLDGTYLHCEKRLADAGPLDSIWYETSQLGEVDKFLDGEKVQPYLPALEDTASVIDGFESPFGMELLATVDYLVSEGEAEPSVEAVREALKHWPAGAAAGQRKLDLFDTRTLGLAVQRLISNGWAEQA